MATEQYETQVAFYPRYNYGATSMMRRPLVDQMNEIIDDLYENRFVWFDSYDQAEDWIQLNNLEDEDDN